MAWFKQSHATVLALDLPSCAILAVDSRVCNSFTARVISDLYDKIIELRPSVFMACFGNCDLIDQVREALANLPIHNFIGEIAHLVQNTVNTVLENSRDDEGEINSSVEFVLLGRGLLDKRYYFYKISKEPNTWMNFAKREVGTVVTAGSNALRTFLEDNNLDENMTEEEAVDYAFKCVKYATQYAWVSGGRIQVVVMKPGGSSIVHAWEQDDPTLCQNEYFYQEPRITQGY